MTEQERRIHELEQELRALKMQNGGGGSGGGGSGVRGSGVGSRSMNLAQGQGQGQTARRGSGSTAMPPAHSSHAGEAGAVYNGVPEGRCVFRSHHVLVLGMYLSHVGVG